MDVATFYFPVLVFVDLPRPLRKGATIRMLGGGGGGAGVVLKINFFGGGKRVKKNCHKAW